MKTFVSFNNQDTALEFNRILRNLMRYQVVREITGGISKAKDSDAYVIGYKANRAGCLNHVVTLLHEGNGLIRVTTWRAPIDSYHGFEEVISTDSETDSFEESHRLRGALRDLAHHVGLQYAALNRAAFCQIFGGLSLVGSGKEGAK